MRHEHPFGGLKLIEPVVYKDTRGYFVETWNAVHPRWAETSPIYVQDNESCSAKGVLRGLHYQCAPHAQAKLVRVIQGAAFDVAVDIRPGSATFGHWYGVQLSGENKWQLYIPEGFAHGFSALAPTTLLAYKCSSPYHAAAEGSIHPLDPQLNIDWYIAEENVLLSDKDAQAPFLGQHKPFST